MALTQPTASETHQAEQEILAQLSDGKKMPMPRISSDAILDKLWNRLSGATLPTVPCIMGSFKVRHCNTHFLQKNKTFCANRSTYKIIVLVKNFPKINLA
jgi:hypothetical protein